jgi:hydroxymethylpyrimidine pyrophosphatase-like HAD family hydrolase
MPAPIQLLSTDFDGTIYAQLENPSIPEPLLERIASLQRQGAKWVINTGRDMSSLMETLGRLRITIEPDYVILVEREMFEHRHSQYLPVSEWNTTCERAHAVLFHRLTPELPRLAAWIEDRFKAQVYSDPYSPFCIIAGNNGDMDLIHRHLNEFARAIPHLTLVRNDVYARFSHAAYNKGTALAELTRRLGLTRDVVFAAGDHLNDLPMLSSQHARFLAAPSNAVPEVIAALERQGGYISRFPCGYGVADALEHFLT